MIVFIDQSGDVHGLDCKTVHNDAGLTPAKVPPHFTGSSQVRGAKQRSGLKIRVSLIRLIRIGLGRSSPFGQLRCPDSIRELIRPWPPLPFCIKPSPYGKVWIKDDPGVSTPNNNHN